MGLKPTVFCNFAMSLDGKISTTDRRGSAFSSREDRRRLELIRARADAIVVGAETVRREDPPFHLRDATLIHERENQGRPAQPHLCVLTRSGHLPAGLRIFRQSVQPVLLAGPDPRLPRGLDSPPDDDPAGLRSGPENSRLGVLAGITSAAELVAELGGRGFRQILVEGGGNINAQFFEASLVDEVYLTLCPVILGGAKAPTPADGAGLPFDQRLVWRLERQEAVDGELFLHYVQSG